MSTLTNYIIGRPGIIGCWPMDEATGTTTIADLGPNTLTGSEVNSGVSRAVLGATGFVTGHATCWQGAASAAGWQLATAANATAQLQTYSIGVFCMQTVAATNGSQLLGRQNGWQIGVNGTTHLLSAASGLSGAPTRGNSTAMTVGTAHLIGLSYDGQELQPWVDGDREGMYDRYASTLASFPNRVIVGGDTGQANNGWKLAVPFIFNRALLPGEWAEIFTLGLGQRTADHAAGFDFVADSNAAVAATSETTRCYATGGRRRLAEGGVSQTSPTRTFTTAHFGAQGRWLGTWPAPTNTATDLQLDGYAGRLTEAVCNAYTTRPTTDSKYYLQSTGQLQPGAQTANYGGLLCGLGMLHRMQGSGASSSFLQRMKLIMSYLRANQIAPGQTKAGYFSTNGLFSGEFGGNGLFTWRQGLAGIIAVWADLDAATRALWLDTLRKHGEADHAWEGPATLGGGGLYWTNGNYTLNRWAALRMMAKLDAAQAAIWQARADAQLAFLFDVSPAASTSYVGGNKTGVGTRRYVDGTPANDPLITLAQMRALNPATDKIYSTEGTSATATAPGNTFNTTYGFDQNYTYEDAAICLNLWVVTQDPDAYQLMQLYTNLVWPYVNVTAGTVTGPTGASVPAWYSDNHGTRHNASELEHIYHGHSMRRLGFTSLMTAQQVADHHVFIESDARLNTTQQNVWYRSLTDTAVYLATSSRWPGFPVIS